MDFSVQSIAATPLKVQHATRKEPLIWCNASQLGLLVKKARMQSVHCRAVDEGGEAVQKNFPAKGEDPASWLHPDTAADPFLGWNAADSQRNHSSKAGWIKIGSALVLGIGFALGARELYTRKEAAKMPVIPLVMTEQALSCSKTSEPVEMQAHSNPVNNQTDSYNMDQAADLQTAFASPDVKEEHNTLAGLSKTIGRILVPASVDPMQEQFFAALQALKVVESGIRPGDICTRREFARWLITASARLSRSPAQKVFPAMYIENASKLAFVDVLPDDPDFSSIQGLAEAGMIYSRLMKDDSEETKDDSPFFLPDGPLTRQDLIMWKRATLRAPAFSVPDTSVASIKALEKLSGFIDINKIQEDAWPALLADIKSGEQSIVALSFGHTRRFQPQKPVTKAQAAAALATGEAWELVTEELARLEAEAMAEAAVAAELALETKASQEVAAAFNELLQREREKQEETASLVEKLQSELEQLKTEREEEKLELLKDRAALVSEKDSVVSMRHEVEQQALLVSTAKLEVSFQRKQVDKLHTEAQAERESIGKVRTELEAEKGALSSARAWAEKEAQRALAHSKILEQVRKRWEYHGVQVRVDKELEETNIPGPSWQYSEGFHGQRTTMDMVFTKANDLVQRVKDAIVRFYHVILIICHAIRQRSMEFSGSLMGKFRDAKIKCADMAATTQRTTMDMVATKANDLVQRAKDAIVRFYHVILILCHAIKQRSMEFSGGLMGKFGDAKIKCADMAATTMAGIQQTLPFSVTGMTASIREGTVKVVAECRGGAERLAHKLKVS